MFIYKGWFVRVCTCCHVVSGWLGYHHSLNLITLHETECFHDYFLTVNNNREPWTMKDKTNDCKVRAIQQGTLCCKKVVIKEGLTDSSFFYFSYYNDRGTFWLSYRCAVSRKPKHNTGGTWQECNASLERFWNTFRLDIYLVIDNGTSYTRWDV